MPKYTFIAEPFGIEIVASGDNLKVARNLAFQQLTNEQRDNCECLDWVDEQADTSPVVPFVHLNGTSKTELLEQRSNFYAALTDALDVLRHMGPNGRDYYPVPGRMELALKQHQRRGEILRALQVEIENEMNEIDKL